MKVNFLTPIKFEGKFPTIGNKCLEFIDSYFDLGQLFKTKIAAVQSYDPLQDRYYCNKKASSSPVWMTAIKIASYITIVLPIVAFVMKAVFRSQKDFFYANSSRMFASNPPPPPNGETPPPPPPPPPPPNIIGGHNAKDANPSIQKQLIDGETVELFAEEISTIQILPSEKGYIKDKNGFNFIRGYSCLDQFKDYYCEVRTKDFSTFQLKLVKIPNFELDLPKVLSKDELETLFPKVCLFHPFNGNYCSEFKSALPKFKGQIFTATTNDFKSFNVTLRQLPDIATL